MEPYENAGNYLVAGIRSQREWRTEGQKDWCQIMHYFFTPKELLVPARFAV